MPNHGGERAREGGRLPLLLMQVENTAARVAAHAMWISPFLGVLYLQVYDYKEKPKWLLAVFEHCE